MKNGGMTYWVFGAMAGMVSLVAVALSLVEHRMPSRGSDRIALGKPLSEEQTVDRRRGAIGTVAVADATTQ